MLTRSIAESGYLHQFLPASRYGSGSPPKFNRLFTDPLPALT